MAARTARAALGARWLTSGHVRQVYLAGQGVVPVSRKKEVTLRGMGAEAIKAAVADAGVGPGAVGGLFVGNMMAGMLSSQQHVGPLLATAAGLHHVETATAEACCGAGGAALRWGYMAVASGMHKTVVVAGVEAMTHADRSAATKGLATASDWEKEGSRGATFVSLNGALMDMYLKKHSGIDREDFAYFSMNAHQNASTCAHATLPKPLSKEDYQNSKVVTEPIRILDASPMCDGAAAVVLTSDEQVARQATGGALIRIAGSGASSDILCVADRPEPLKLEGVARSTEQALGAAGITRGDVDIFELHDAYAIMACLSLESAGFAKPGEGVRMAREGALGLAGEVPIATFGGLKARGHPVGATGVYQAAEMLLQMTDRAGANQVKKGNGVRVAMTQNIGGAGSSVFSHVFIREA